MMRSKAAFTLVVNIKLLINKKGTKASWFSWFVGMTWHEKDKEIIYFYNLFIYLFIVLDFGVWTITLLLETRFIYEKIKIEVERYFIIFI